MENLGGYKASNKHMTTVIQRLYQPTMPERDFIQAKQPQGHSETIAALAYYLTESGLPEFTEEDVRRAYTGAGVRPPKVVG